MRQLKSLRSSRKQLGQGMTEYIIIVALVAIAAIGVYAYFGQTVRGQMASITSQLAGKSGQSGLGQAKTSSTDANTQATNQDNLGTYAKNSADSVGQ
ncbi:MAG: Flp family type IVb pilin [Gammaproteobacteria bacterium]